MSELKKETEKWLLRIEPVASKIRAEEKGIEFLENMKAYISDSKHFLKEGDLVRAFECVIWAWSIYEICLELGLFKIEK